MRTLAILLATLAVVIANYGAQQSPPAYDGTYLAADYNYNVGDSQLSNAVDVAYRYPKRRHSHKKHHHSKSKSKSKSDSDSDSDSNSNSNSNSGSSESNSHSSSESHEHKHKRHGRKYYRRSHPGRYGKYNSYNQGGYGNNDYNQGGYNAPSYGSSFHVPLGYGSLFNFPQHGVAAAPAQSQYGQPVHALPILVHANDKPVDPQPIAVIRESVEKKVCLIYKA
ncbi:hypothetical protein WR25_01989 isoform C [Diploscapter pachys]|uniref:Uncharacterized protein n=1 Tax=Diploscapter pachys TaxID=2018661 RepID=A0A2A2L4G7_9BILA|nr:hypothetical protein WR25_01989 isoform C [Diploscapter pachys]